jgi:hypothetical protein
VDDLAAELWLRRNTRRYNEVALRARPRKIREIAQLISELEREVVKREAAMVKLEARRSRLLVKCGGKK